MTQQPDVTEVLTGWLERRGAADAPSPDELLAAHPTIADELRAGLAGLGFLRRETS